MSDKILDTTGLLCPLPVIKTQNQVADMRPGQVLKIICTDPGALYDIPVWCRLHGHDILQKNTGNDKISLKIRIN